jgi:hypothetical protein
MLLCRAITAMPRHLAHAIAAALLMAAVPFAAFLAAQTDVTGEWAASYTAPLGPQELTIYLTQEGPRVTGHTTSEFGESQVRGTIDGQDVTFTFSSTDGGKAVEVRVTAKVDGERMRGTAKIGDRADGVFTAERTGS